MDRDEWETPWEIFNPINKIMNFTVDAAASPLNSKLDYYWTVEDNGLSQDWAGQTVWCNPPYLNQAHVSWIQKAATTRHPSCLLIPASVATRVWQDWVFGNPILFFRGRIKFLLNGKSLGSPRFDSAAVFYHTTFQQLRRLSDLLNDNHRLGHLVMPAY